MAQKKRKGSIPPDLATEIVQTTFSLRGGLDELKELLKSNEKLLEIVRSLQEDAQTITHLVLDNVKDQPRPRIPKPNNVIAFPDPRREPNFFQKDWDQNVH